MKKLWLRLVIGALLLTTILSMSACGNNVRVRAVCVENDDFFRQLYSDYGHNDLAIPQDSKYYEVACAISGSADEFMRRFLWQYDSNTGMALILEVRNHSKETIRATGLQTENNGYEGVYVSTCIDMGEPQEIPAGQTAQVRIRFMGNGGVYTNGEFITKIFKQMPMQLQLENESGEKWTQEVRIKADDDMKD